MVRITLLKDLLADVLATLLRDWIYFQELQDQISFPYYFMYINESGDEKHWLAYEETIQLNSDKTKCT